MQTMYIKTRNNICLYFGDKNLAENYSLDDEQGQKVWEFIKNEDEEGLLKYISKSELKLALGVDFEVKNGMILYKGRSLPTNLSDKIISLKKDNLSAEAYLKFAQKLFQNPSFQAVQELYDFLVKHGSPINADGDFVAWKKVRADLTDVHTGTFDNTPGTTVKIDRNRVDDNREVGCSHGLHVGSLEYARGFSGTRLLEIAVNPANVVSVPHDCNFQKVRVCEYYVVREIPASEWDIKLTQDSINARESVEDEVEEDEEDVDACAYCGDEYCDGVCDEDDYEEDDEDEWDDEDEEVECSNPGYGW